MAAIILADGSVITWRYAAFMATALCSQPHVLQQPPAGLRCAWLHCSVQLGFLVLTRKSLLRSIICFNVQLIQTSGGHLLPLFLLSRLHGLSGCADSSGMLDQQCVVLLVLVC